MKEQEFFKYLSEKGITLTESQKEAVITVDGPMCLISTAGSGKTTVLTARIAYMILCKNIASEKILVTSFSNQSAADMCYRFNKIFGEKITEKVKFSTIHSFAFYVFRDYARRINMNYSVIEGVEGAVSKNILLSTFYKKYTNENITEDKLKDLNGFVSYVKNLMILYKDLDNYKEQFPIPCFKEIYKDYEEFKRDYIDEFKGKIRLLDFDDMLSMCYHALKRNSELLDEYRAIYDYILIDEAQDTSKIQGAIARLIAAPKYNICLVGDPNQSIYSWRGAVVGELVNFKEVYHKNGKMLFMDQNFRSTKTIVNAANEFIKVNRERIERNTFTENEQGEPIEFISCEDEFHQIEYILQKLKKEQNFKSNAVLYRNNLSAIPLIEKLNKEGIPFYVKDEIPSFFSHWVTRDILNLFTFSENQWNVELFETIYYKIRTYINKKDVVALYYNLTSFDKVSKSVFDRLAENLNYKGEKERFRDFKYKFEMLSRMRPSKAIEYIEHELNYRDYLKDYAKKFNYSMDNIDVMLSTLKIIAGDLNNISELTEKLEGLQLQMAQSKKNRRENAVTLSTCHSAKGLEWNNVFLIDTQNLPSGDCLKVAREDKNYAPLEEEARVFFVSITRARKKLYVMYPMRKNGQRTDTSMFYNRLLSVCMPSKRKNINSINTEINIVPKLEIGKCISHKKWGKGRILEIDGDIFKVMMIDGSVRKLSATICFKSGLVEII